MQEILQASLVRNLTRIASRLSGNGNYSIAAGVFYAIERFVGAFLASEDR